MTEIQKYLLELLKEIDYICKKYDIEYYLGGGTLIGAIRHNGFLPWDDDADIHMSRENAQKFLEALREEKLENRIIYTGDEDDKYGSSHWRYQNTKTTALLRSLVGTDSPQGQFVDIFINYPLPKDDVEAQKCLDFCEVYIELKASNFTISSINNRNDRFFLLYKRMKRLEKIIGKKRVLKHLGKKIFFFSEDEAENWFIWSPDPPKRSIPKKWWGKPKRIIFENVKLPVAEYSEKILCYQYGPNWYEIPERIDRETHTIVTDFEIPYYIYTREYSKHLDPKDIYNFEVMKKKYWFNLLRRRNTINPQIHRLKGRKIVMELEYEIKKNNLDLIKLVNEGREAELNIIFDSYFKFLARSDIKYWGLYIDMPDEYLYAALYFSCFNGNYIKAKKILNKRRKIKDRELPKYLNSLCEICDVTDRLLIEIYTNMNYEAAENIINVWLDKYPNLLYFMRAEIYIDIKKKVKIEKILSKCNKYLKVYRKDGELLKYKGDILLKLNMIEEAEKYYRIALSTLRNGYCITDIKNYFNLKESEKNYERTTKKTIGYVDTI